MINTSYSLKTVETLKSFLSLYIPLVLHAGQSYGLDLESRLFACDHIGYQAIGTEDYDICVSKLTNFAQMISETNLHDRRVIKYKFEDIVKIGEIVVPGIEVFEPKPGADIPRLKAGIEHIAFTYKGDFKKFYETTLSSGVPVEKYVQSEHDAFFKIKFIDLVEIEFRDTSTF